jgi:hypothetical protein
LEEQKVRTGGPSSQGILELTLEPPLFERESQEVVGRDQEPQSSCKRRRCDIVIGGYDFAMLCTVTREALLARKRISDKRKKLIKSFFNDCHGLANPSRNIVAHALWTTGGASHVSRNSLQRSLHYRDLNDLRALTTKAKALMMRRFRDRI